MKYVANSSTPEVFYSFFLPIISIAWKKMGYEPLSLLFGDEALWRADPLTSFVYDAAARHSRIHFTSPVQNFKNATVSQIARFFPAAISGFKEDDYFIAGEADMIPLDPVFCNKQDMKYKAHILEADYYGQTLEKEEIPRRFRGCYVGATYEAWRKILEITTFDLSLEIQKALFMGRDHWNNDEYYLTHMIGRSSLFSGPLERIDESSFRKGEFQLFMRKRANVVCVRRLDRRSWRFNGETDLIDCHSVRPAYENKKVEVLLKMLSVYFPESFDIFKAYIQDFRDLKAKLSHE